MGEWLLFLGGLPGGGSPGGCTIKARALCEWGLVVCGACGGRLDRDPPERFGLGRRELPAVQAALAPRAAERFGALTGRSLSLFLTGGASRRSRRASHNAAAISDAKTVAKAS